MTIQINQKKPKITQKKKNVTRRSNQKNAPFSISDLQLNQICSNPKQIINQKIKI